MNVMIRLTTAILALMLALPTLGCQQKEKAKENEKGLDVQIDAGKTKLKLEGNQKPDGKGGHLHIDVQRDPGHEPGDRDKD